MVGGLKQIYQYPLIMMSTAVLTMNYVPFCILLSIKQYKLYCFRVRALKFAKWICPVPSSFFQSIHHTSVFWACLLMENTILINVYAIRLRNRLLNV